MNPKSKKGKYERLVSKFLSMEEFWRDRHKKHALFSDYFSAGVARCRETQIAECREWLERIYVKGEKP